MIVKSVRAVGRVAGSVIDEDDRKVIGVGLVYVAAIALLILAIAAASGFAIQVFEYTRG